MAGFLPKGLPLTTDMPGIDDIFIIQKDTENEVKSIKYSDLLKKGVADGVCPLGIDRKIPNEFIPSLSITDVYVVADIPARDALTVQKGDVVKVTDSDGAGHPQTYIYDGTSFIDIQETSDVIEVNGKTGVVSLTTVDIPVSGGNNYLSDTEKTKLAGIEDGATADMTASEIKTAYESNADTNAYTDAEKTKLANALVTSDIGVSVQAYDANTVIDANYVHTDENYTTAEKTKLAGIEDGATADMTASEIKTAYESNADTNAYTDAEKTKLATLEAMSSWSACGTIGTTNNTTAETTVDSTFRVIEALSTATGVLNLTADTTNHNITISTAGKYRVSVECAFDSDLKEYEIFVFKNGTQTEIGFNDRSDGKGASSWIVDLAANDVLDLRQRSTNGGSSLTIQHANISVNRVG